jgi:hypothetical protein
MSDPELEPDATSTFLAEADRIVRDASFIVDSLPNVEPFSAERSLRKLVSVRDILLRLHDPWLSAEDLAPLVSRVEKYIVPLEAFRREPELPRNTGTRRVPSARGPAHYDLDLKTAVELHDAGNSWEDVAAAFGVHRGTIYNHLHRAGISTARPAFTEIADDELDEWVAQLSLKQPFSGAKIILGGLEAAGIHLPIEAVKASLRRVDYIGAITR